MTNFEKWKDEILEIDGLGKLAVVDGTPVNCRKIDCSVCDFSKVSNCERDILNWLYEEYKEATPKLSKRDKEFCEALHNIVDQPCAFSIGRTPAGNMYLAVHDSVKFCLDNTSFKCIKATGEWSLTDLLKLEVEE